MDLISRQDAIDALGEEPEVWSVNDEYDVGLRNQWRYDVNAIKDLPSAQRKGKWYKPTGMMPPEYAGAYRCSECDEFAMRDWKTHRQKLTDFCPHCGARMKGEEA